MKIQKNNTDGIYFRKAHMVQPGSAIESSVMIDLELV